MAADKKRVPKRKKDKKAVEQVRFTLETWDDEFELPSMMSMTYGEQRKLAKGDPDTLTRFLEKNGAGDYVDLIDDLDADEIMELIKAWNEASGVDMGKLQDRSR